MHSLSSIFGGPTNFKGLNSSNPSNYDLSNGNTQPQLQRHSSSQLSLHSLNISTTTLSSSNHTSSSTDSSNNNTTHPAHILQSNLQDKYIHNKASSNRSLFSTKYNIVKNGIIGEGASSNVYLINSQKDTNKLYAMKVFHPNRVLPDSYNTHLRKIILEYSIGAILTHQNIVATTDLLIDHHNKSAMIILEYVPYDLVDLVMANILREPEVACLFKQLCHAIQYMHSIGIAHRDLKLDNCVVTPQGILKLIDLGSAIVFTSSSSSSSVSDGIVGSDPYLAPELLEPLHHRSHDPRPIDVWALAIMYYCMLLNKFPWKAPRTSFNSFRLFCEDPDDEEDVSKGPQRLLRALPPPSQHIIAQMLQLNPRDRVSIDSILDDAWVQSIQFCHYNNNGNFIQQHKHHFIPKEPTTTSTPSSQINIHSQTNRTLSL